MEQTIPVAMLELGCICLGGLFVIGVARHKFEQVFLTAMMRVRGVPWPRLTLLTGSVFQIVAGALLMADLLPSRPRQVWSSSLSPRP